MIPTERNAHGATVQRRVVRIHSSSSLPDRRAAIAKANGTVRPT